MVMRRASVLIPCRKSSTDRTRRPQRALSEPGTQLTICRPEDIGEHSPDDKRLPSLMDMPVKDMPVMNLPVMNLPVTELPDACVFEKTETTGVVELTETREVAEHEMASEMEPSSSDSGTVARCTSARPLKIRFCRPSSSGSLKKSSKAKRQVYIFSVSSLCTSTYFIRFNSNFISLDFNCEMMIFNQI